MIETLSASWFWQQKHADAALKKAAEAWFLTAVVGQWIFLFYILAFYGPLVLQGGIKGLAGTGMPGGYIPGDVIGNAAVAAHLVLAAIIIGGGPLQLIPQVRSRFPSFHHWNGRIYLPAVFIASISGLYLTWTRDVGGNVIQDIGVSLNAVLIVVFGVIAFRYALVRKIEIHRRWALRLFLVVNGVWFFRVGLMLWMFMTGGAGIDRETFTGPFLTFLNFGQYLVPLAVLELYLRAQDHGSALGKLMIAAALLLLTGAMGVGVFMAYMGLWLPRI